MPLGAVVCVEGVRWSRTDPCYVKRNSRGEPSYVLIVDMNIIAWNCRGTAGNSTLRELKVTCQSCDPDIVFLSETKCDTRRIETITRRIGFTRSFSIPAENNAGGLAVLWKDPVALSFSFADKNQIHSEVSNKENPGQLWWLSLVYAPPYYGLK